MGVEVRRAMSVSVWLVLALCLAACSRDAVTLSMRADGLPESDCSAQLFAEGWDRSLAATFDGLAVTASVHDTATDCTYALHDDVRLTTASAIKLQILAANLARVEDLDRPLGAQEREHAERMLWYSHNSPPTSQLYVAVGTSGMERFSEAVGASSVHHTPIYGITETNALELNLATRATLDLHATTSPLTIESRQFARDLLADVHFTQRWGVSAGLPADHEVWLKNGFFPCTRCRPFGGVYTWRVSSTGFVERPDGTGWAITILTDGSTTQRQGMRAVEAISRHVAGLLAEGDPVDRPVETANCTTVESGESALSATVRLGLSAEDWPDVKWVSGNESPLSGQLICAPEPLTGLSACVCPDRTSQ